MAITKDIGTLLAKRMDRKDFLKHVGIAVIAATGVGAALKALAGDNDKPAEVGYGDLPYGGFKKQS